MNHLPSKNRSITWLPYNDFIYLTLVCLCVYLGCLFVCVFVCLFVQALTITYNLNNNLQFKHCTIDLTCLGLSGIQSARPIDPRVPCSDWGLEAMLYMMDLEGWRTKLALDKHCVSTKWLISSFPCNWQ